MGSIQRFLSLQRENAFGNSFPLICSDESSIRGFDQKLFDSTLKSEIPDILLPLNQDIPPALFDLLDLLEFCYKNVAKPEVTRFHYLYDRSIISKAMVQLGGFDPDKGHNHFSYDIEAGRLEFRENINLIFSRNGIIYDLNDNGQVIRLAPEGLREQLQQTIFHTGDVDLDELLNTARTKFLNPHIVVRKESLEKLWGAWERLKTIEPGNKKTSITTLLEKTSPDPNFYNRLNAEASELTEIGNQFRIRHHEIGKIPITSSDQVDYLFHRMFSLIYLILKSTNRIK